MSKTVLIVDDAYFMRNLLKKALKEAGYEVIGEAKNGKEGIRLYFELHPDIVTMDINMPDISGIEATKQIMSKDPSAKIIAVTGNSDENIKREILEAGAQEYLQKPFQPAFLWNKLDKMLKEEPEETEEALELDEPVTEEIPSEHPKRESSIVVSAEEIEDDFDSLEIEIRDKPDESKSMTFVIENEEDSIEFPEEYQEIVEEEKEKFELSKEKLEQEDEPNPLMEEDDMVIELEEDEPLDITPPHSIHQPHSIKQPIVERPVSPTPPPPANPNPPYRRKTNVEPTQKTESNERFVSTVEITKAKKTDRKIEEINIRPHSSSGSSGIDVDIRPPRGKILKENRYDTLDEKEIEEPILNVSDEENYNNDKNNGLISIVKKLFKK